MAVELGPGGLQSVAPPLEKVIRESTRTSEVSLEQQAKRREERRSEGSEISRRAKEEAAAKAAAERERIRQESEKQRKAEVFKAKQELQEKLKELKGSADRASAVRDFQKQAELARIRSASTALQKGGISGFTVTTQTKAPGFTTTRTRGGELVQAATPGETQKIRLNERNLKKFLSDAGISNIKERNAIIEQTTQKLQSEGKPLTYKEYVKEFGPVTGTLRSLGEKAERFVGKQVQPVSIEDIQPQRLRGSIGPEQKISELLSTEEKAAIQESKQKAAGSAAKTVAETAPFFIPYVGPALLVGTGVERVTTPGGKKELNEFGKKIESVGLPSELKYALPITEIGLGTFGLASELRTLSNVRQATKNVPIGEIKTTSVSANRQAVTNQILSTADDDLKIFISRNKLSGTRVYETTIPTKAGIKRIQWLELSNLKGPTPELLKGRRILVGVELDAKGKVISKLGGLTIEKSGTETSNLLTTIIRKSKNTKKFTLNPKETEELLQFAEEVKITGTKKIGRGAEITRAEAKSGLLQRKELIGGRESIEALSKKPLLKISSKGIPKPFEGIKQYPKVTTEEIRLFGKPKLSLSAQKVGKGKIITAKGTIKDVSIGIQKELKPALKIKVVTKGRALPEITTTTKKGVSLLRKGKPGTSGLIEPKAIQKSTESLVKPSSVGQSLARELGTTTAVPGRTTGGVGRLFRGLRESVFTIDKTEVKPVVKDIGKLESKIKLRLKEQLDTGTKSLQEQLSKPKQVEVVREEVKIAQVPKISLSLKPKLSQELQRPRQDIRARIRTTQPPRRIERAIIPPPAFSSSKRTLKRVSEAPARKVPVAYYAEVKERGVWKKVIKQPLELKQAKALAQYTTDRTLGASARIRPTKMFKKLAKINAPLPKQEKFRDYIIRKGKRIATPNKWIEKRKYRLDVPKETQTIQEFRKTAAFKKLLVGAKKRK